jgi:DNA repair protein RadC
MSKGGITGTLCRCAYCFKTALDGSNGINFMSQSSIRDFNSSDADKQITKKIKINSLEIKVLDHLIVTETSYFSFVDEGIF